MRRRMNVERVLTLSRALKVLGVVFLLAFLAPVSSYAGYVRWEDRVLPLPKEMGVEGVATVSAGEIGYEFLTEEDAPVYKTARSLLNSFAKAGEGAGGGVNILLVLTGENPGEVPDPLYGRLGGLPNRGQAYTISHREGPPRELTLAANTPTGLLYAVRTLTQLIAPGDDVTPEAQLEIPLAVVVDWPDIEQRGTTSSPGRSSIGWYSQWKLNKQYVRARAQADGSSMIRLSYSGPTIDGGKRDYFEWAEEIGYTIVPGEGHVGSLSAGVWKDISPAVYTGEHPAPRVAGFCWSHEGIHEVFTDHLRYIASQARKSPEGYKDIGAWLTELGNISCYCDDCAGEDGYVLETRGLARAWEKVREEYPGVRFRIATSQGSRSVNDRIIDIAREHDIGVTYYDGALTYRTTREPLIFSELEEYAAEGGVVGAMLTLTPGRWSILHPGSIPQYAQLRAQEFADKELTVAAFWGMHGHFHYALTHAAWAEYNWNAHGRSTRDFARAYATITGIAEPELFSRWAEKAGEAAFELGVSQYMDNLWRGNYGRFPRELESDEFQKLNTIRIDRVMDGARGAVRLAHEADNSTMKIESETVLAGLKSIRLRQEIRELLRAGEKDAAGKKLEELDLYAQLVRANIYKWHRMAIDEKERLQKGTGYMSPPDSLRRESSSSYTRKDLEYWGAESLMLPGATRQMAHALLRASDVDWDNASLYGLLDNRGEWGPVEVAEWEWTEGDGSEKITVDLCGFVPLSGGDYNLGLNHLDGPRPRWRSTQVVSVDTRTGERNVLFRDVMWLPGFRGSIVGRSDRLLKVPERKEDENLFLELGFSHGKGSAGYATLRRVRPRDEFSDEDIDRLLK